MLQEMDPLVLAFTNCSDMGMWIVWNWNGRSLLGAIESGHAALPAIALRFCACRCKNDGCSRFSSYARELLTVSLDGSIDR